MVKVKFVLYAAAIRRWHRSSQERSTNAGQRFSVATNEMLYYNRLCIYKSLVIQRTNGG